MKYSVRLVEQSRNFFDHKAKIYLGYYNPQGETDTLTDELKKAVKFGTLRDMNGEIVKVLEAEALDVKAKVKQEEKAKVENIEVKEVEPAKEAPVEQPKEDAGDDAKAEKKAEKAKTVAKRSPAKTSSKSKEK